MIPLTLAELAVACGGRLEGDPQVLVSGVTTDSRSVQPGDLFLGLRGERFDGDAYAAAALVAGAAAVVVRAETAVHVPRGCSRIVVDDGLVALQRIARAVRLRLPARVVGVTGSAGKTSTKDILTALLRPVARVTATYANLNNEIGLPLTVLAASPETEVLVVEMGMRGFGQIRELARIALPEIGVITSVAPVHLEAVGTLAGVAAAKAELIEELGEGTAVLPASEPLLQEHARGHRGCTVTFGIEGGDVRAVAVEHREGTTQALVEAFGRRERLTFGFTGRHYLEDALAALAVFLELGYPLEAAREGAARVVFSDLRGALTPLRGGGVVLNDAYNANPTAMKAAIDHLVEVAAGRPTVAVIGDMYELGADAEAYHEEVGAHCAAVGVRVVAVGELARHYLKGAPGERWYATVEECIEALPELVPAGSAVLVKASRLLRLERVAEALLREGGERC